MELLQYVTNGSALGFVYCSTHANPDPDPLDHWNFSNLVHVDLETSSSQSNDVSGLVLLEGVRRFNYCRVWNKLKARLDTTRTRPNQHA